MTKKSIFLTILWLCSLYIWHINYYSDSSAYYIDMVWAGFWLYSFFYYAGVIILWYILWLILRKEDGVYSKFFMFFSSVYLCLFILPHFLFDYSITRVDTWFWQPFFYKWYRDVKFIWFIWFNFWLYVFFSLINILNLIDSRWLNGIVVWSIFTIFIPWIYSLYNQSPIITDYIHLHSFIWKKHIPQSQELCHTKFPYYVCQWLSSQIWEEMSVKHCKFQSEFEKYMYKWTNSSFKVRNTIKDYVEHCINSVIDSNKDNWSEYFNCKYMVNAKYTTPKKCIIEWASKKNNIGICSIDLGSKFKSIESECKETFIWRITRSHEGIIKECSQKKEKKVYDCMMHIFKRWSSNAISHCDLLADMIDSDNLSSIISECKIEWETLIQKRLWSKSIQNHNNNKLFSKNWMKIRQEKYVEKRKRLLIVMLIILVYILLDNLKKTRIKKK